MLVHHANAGMDGVLGSCEIGRLAVDQDFALVRAVETAENVHQRRLAGTVLPQQAEDLSGTDIEMYVRVGDHRTEALGDAA